MTPEFLDLFRDIVPKLGLEQAGLVTPWARRVGDLQWADVGKAETNIALYPITDATLQQVKALFFNSPLPWVAVLSRKAVTQSELQALANKTAYEFFEAVGVYSQADLMPIPAPWFLYWFRIRDQANPGGSQSIQMVAQQIGGALMFAQQVPSESTTVRPAPGISFTQALELDKLVPPDLRGRAPGWWPPAVRWPPEKPVWWPPVLSWPPTDVPPDWFPPEMTWPPPGLLPGTAVSQEYLAALPTPEELELGPEVAPTTKPKVNLMGVFGYAGLGMGVGLVLGKLLGGDLRR